MDTRENEPVITTEPVRRRVRARLNGSVIADSKEAIVLRERGRDPVYYFPREDVETGYLGPTEHTTRCPYKGEANYWTFVREGNVLENAVWSYEHPDQEDAADIAGLMAFDLSQGFEVEEVEERDVH